VKFSAGASHAGQLFVRPSETATQNGFVGPNNSTGTSAITHSTSASPRDTCRSKYIHNAYEYDMPLNIQNSDGSSRPDMACNEASMLITSKDPTPVVANRANLVICAISLDRAGRYLECNRCSTSPFDGIGAEL